MENRNDVEKIIRRFRKKPGETVRRNVLARFELQVASKAPETAGPPLWRKSIPVYAVAVLLFVCAAGAFVAGRQSSGIGPPEAGNEPATPETILTTAEDIPWHTTARDLL
jgi:hypothetical protein